MNRRSSTDSPKSSDNFPELLTIKETAEYLRVHPSTIYRLIKEKRIPAFRVGSDYRIVRKTLEQSMMDSMQKGYEAQKGRKMRVAR